MFSGALSHHHVFDFFSPGVDMAFVCFVLAANWTPGLTDRGYPVNVK
jgi:hypothetical protein